MPADVGTSRRTVIVSGNCQSRFLFRCLRRNTAIQDAYEPVFVRNRGQKGIDSGSEADIVRCRFLLEQIGHKTSDLPSKELLPADCTVIRYPVVWLNSLWPTHIDEPRNKPSPEFPRGTFPYGDSIILRLLDQGLTPEEASAAFLAGKLSDHVDLGRFHEINAAKARMLDQRADLKFGTYILERFRSERLFVNHNHPAPGMLRYMADSIAAAIGFGGLELGFPKSTRDGIGPMHVPIHPEVAEFFQLDWYDPNESYRWYDHQFSAGEYYRRYAAMDYAGS